MQPVHFKKYGHGNVYVDGGLLANYPITCFDGNIISECHTYRYKEYTRNPNSFVERDDYLKMINRFLMSKYFYRYVTK